MTYIRLSALLLLAACAPFSSGATAPGTTTTHAIATEPPDRGSRVLAPHAAVTSANGLASDAGLEILRAGGNAVDAAVATAFAIGVVEPQMSGVGGSGSALVWWSGERRPHYLDFYAAQNAASFRGHTGPRAGEKDLRIVGTPGGVAGLLALHEKFGALPRERVIAPAIRLAEQGFPVGQTLARFIAGDSAELHLDRDAAAYLWPNGRPVRPGTVLKNPELAGVLRGIAAEGAAGFYRGDVARKLLAEMRAGGHPASAADLTGYAPQWKRPLCALIDGRIVLSAPPPQTGMQVLETLRLLEPYDLRAIGLPTTSPRAFDLLVSALRVGMADADVNNDPRWGSVPATGVASAGFARARAPLVGTGQPRDTVPTGEAGRFEGELDAACVPLLADAEVKTEAEASRHHPGPSSAAPDRGASDEAETTHISVVDANGNAVALTQTNSTLWGSGAFVEGFFLNDSGYIFRDSTGLPTEPRWRTRNSTIAPTIALRGGRVELVIGAPGGGRIPTEIAQVMVYIMDYGMDPMAAVRMPRIYPNERHRRVELEHGFAPDLLRGVRELGYDPVAESFGYARLYLIARAGEGWIAVADPRHDGEARGY